MMMPQERKRGGGGGGGAELRREKKDKSVLRHLAARCKKKGRDIKFGNLFFISAFPRQIMEHFSLSVETCGQCCDSRCSANMCNVRSSHFEFRGFFFLTLEESCQLLV